MQRIFKIAVNGTSYDVTVEELGTASSAQIMPSYMGSSASVLAAQVAPQAVAAPSAPIAAGAGDQVAQMGGVVAGILVKEGQMVSSGDRLLELEAMKMKVPLLANASGKVARILVEVGASVVAGQALIVIE